MKQLHRFLCAWFMLLAFQGAHAATYSLPAALGQSGTPFSICSASTNQCSGSISLGVNDVVNLTSNLSLTITGNLTLGNGVTINSGAAYTLSLTVNGNLSTGTSAVIVGNVTAGGTLSLGVGTTVTGNITATGPVTLGNNASVYGNVTGSSITFDNSNTAVFGSCTPSYPQCTGFKLTKTASAGSGLINDVITFTITASNTSTNPWNSVVVTDVLPSSMSYSAAAPGSGTVAVSGQTITWSIPSIPAGGSAQLVLAVKLLTAGVQTNTVTAPNASSASASVLVLSSAVTHYRMDETVGSWSGQAGEVLDSGTTALHGRRITTTSPTSTNTVSPSPTIASQRPSVVGGFCNAGSFDGKGVVQVPSNALFQYTNKFSASAWIYPTSYPSGGSDLYSVLSNDTNYEFHLNPSGKLYWWWGGPTLTSAATIPLNQWTHVAITFSSASGAGRQRIYINGVLDSNTSSWTGTLTTNACPFYIGGDVATGAACSLRTERNFRGNIDEVKLYNYELSSTEVQADMTLGRNCTGTFDHLQIEHDGSGSVCAPENVTVKACLNASCTSLYTGNVTVNLSPSLTSPDGWTGGNTFVLSGGVATRSLSVGSASTVTLGVTSASPTPTNATTCVNTANGSSSCSVAFTAASCNFDAVEVGANPKTDLFTKLANTAFNVDIVAVAGSAVDTTSSATVTVDLVDASTTTCPTGTGLTSTQNVTLVNGRKSATFTYAQAAPNVRVRMKQGSSTAGCSTDNFAIRPQSFAVSSSNANADAAGTNATATPRLKTGASFTLTADTNTAGYGGTPTLDTTKLSAHAGAAQTGTLAGSFTTAASSATGNGASGAAFTYSEVGYFRLNADAVTDSSFTAVDNTVADCVVGSSSNTLSGGKYGCNIGSTQSSYFGRFIPDRFITAVTPTCGSGTLFSYAGQPFSVQVTAQNASGATTQNYQGSSWAKAVTLSSALAAPASISCLATPCTGAAALSGANITASSFVSGVASATPSYGYQNTAGGATSTYAMAAPYALQVRATDTDTVTSSGFTEGSTTVRSGRVRLSNAYGSERLDLPMPMRAEYWGSGNAWLANPADTCTTTTLAFSAVSGVTDIRSSSCVRDSGNPGASGRGCAAAGVAARQFKEAGVAGFAGDFNLWLQAPSVTGAFIVTADLAGSSWLRFPWSGTTAADPSGRATFGVYKSPLIYRRENY